MGFSLTACANYPWGQHLDALAKLSELEDQRPKGVEAQLAAMLRHESSWLRARAAIALGRIGTVPTTAPLCTALSDEDPDVRRAVIFALGQTRATESKPQARGALLPLLRSKDPTMRAAACIALGRISAFELAEEVVPLLADSSARVRQAAALTLQRLRANAAAAKAQRPREVEDHVLAALIREARAAPSWQVIYALAGLREPRAVPPLLAASGAAKSPLQRLFAVRGLAGVVRRHKLAPKVLARVEQALIARLDDADVRVGIEAALALGDPSASGRNSAARGTPPIFDTEPTLRALILHSSATNPHLAAMCVRGLGHFQNRSGEARPALSIAEASPIPTVRSEAILAHARLLGDPYAGILDIHGRAEDWRTRVATGQAMRFLSVRNAVRLARDLMQDNDTRVRLAALNQLAHCKDDRGALDLARAGLDDKDLALRESAAHVLASIGDVSVLPDLERAYAAAQGTAASDVRLEIIHTVATLGGKQEHTRALLRRALRDPVMAVRAAAHEAWVQAGAGQARPVVSATATAPRTSAIPGQALQQDFLIGHPIVRCTTNKGFFDIELFPAAAPTHCFNFIELVRRNAYDGRIFHRVVPNFVVQGGDRRGDGYGNQAWWGGKLRLEVNDLPFLTGSVGMPRSSDPDSGGDQLFITTLPTPHLDGRYTVFGRVTTGLDVVLALEVGDSIDHMTIQ